MQGEGNGSGRLVKGPTTRAGACRFAACGFRMLPGQDHIEALSELIRGCNMRKASHISWACILSGNGRVNEKKGDGGERGAGNVILDVLRKSSSKNVLIAVARWYGGKHLGGLRFRIYSRLTSQTLEIL